MVVEEEYKYLLIDFLEKVLMIIVIIVEQMAIELIIVHIKIKSETSIQKKEKEEISQAILERAGEMSRSRKEIAGEVISDFQEITEISDQVTPEIAELMINSEVIQGRAEEVQKTIIRIKHK